MTEYINVKIGGHRFKAALHMEEAPETCRRILETHPITGNVIQARWGWEAVWLQMDPHGFDAPLENQTSHPSRGELLYYPGGVSEKEILIPYGSTCFASRVGQLLGSHFAMIVEGAEWLTEMGEKTLWEGAQEISIESG
jgi:hypothetical protein